MNWIRQEKRLAIYLRDGCACVWCGFAVEDGATLTLDHVKPHSKGGSNHETNLVTSCKRCNDSRGARSVAKFCDAIAAYLNNGIDPASILVHVKNSQRRAIDVQGARALIERRGSAFKVLQSRSKS